MTTLDDALAEVHRTMQALADANRAPDSALGSLAPAGYAIRALTVALDLALRELGRPPIDPLTAHLQGRRT